MRYDRVFLIGLMGVGKTTVGHRLAESFGYQHFDVDQYIVQESGQSVNEIFKNLGEPAFRQMEVEAIDLLSQRGQIVLSTGGGCVEREESCQRLRERGVVIYLHGSPTMLFARLRNDQQRPLLQTQDPLARLQELYAKRDPLYRQTAHVVVESSEASLRFTTNQVIRALNDLG